MSEKDLQKTVVRVLLIVTQSVQSRLHDAPQLQEKVLAKYDKILRALMASLALQRCEGRLLQKIADCFVTILNQADALG